MRRCPDRLVILSQLDPITTKSTLYVRILSRIVTVTSAVAEISNIVDNTEIYLIVPKETITNLAR